MSLRVHEIVDAHPTLKVTVVTNTQASRIADRVAQIAPKGSGECVSLRGYGAIRNMGLACAARPTANSMTITGRPSTKRQRM